MLFGVSYTIVLAYFFVCLMYFTMTSDFRGWGAMPIFHAFGYVLSEKEPLFMELFMIKQSKCNKCKNRFYHGMTNSYDLM